MLHASHFYPKGIRGKKCDMGLDDMESGRGRSYVPFYRYGGRATKGGKDQKTYLC